MERNDHWHEWREAARRTGFTPELKRAAEVLEQLDSMTPAQVEELFKQSD